MRVIDAVPGSKIYVGQQLEDKATMVRFDASPFYSLYGDDGTFSLRVQRYGEAEGYPIGYPSVYAEDGYVCWKVASADVAIAGENEVQVRYLTEDSNAMSMKWIYVVKDSIVLGETVPAPMEEWADAISEAAANILDMTVSAHTSSTPEVIKTGGSGTPVNLDFGIPSSGGGGTGGSDDASNIYYRNSAATEFQNKSLAACLEYIHTYYATKAYVDSLVGDVESILEALL